MSELGIEVVAPRIPKIGEVVYLEAWDVVGEVREVRDFGSGMEVTLCWPRQAFWPRDFQPFQPVRQGEFQILETPQDALKVMGQLFMKWRDAAVARHREHARRGEREILTGSYFFWRNG